MKPIKDFLYKVMIYSYNKESVSCIKREIEHLEKEGNNKKLNKYILSLTDNDHDLNHIKEVINNYFPQYKDLLKTILVFQ